MKKCIDIPGRDHNNPQDRAMYCAFGQQKNQAQHRKEIWEISFIDWKEMWLPYWDKRGRGKDQYRMARKNRLEPWRKDNLAIGIPADLLAYVKPGWRPNRRVSINGEIYAMAASAGRKLKIHPGTVKGRCESVKFPNYFFIDEEQKPVYRKVKGRVRRPCIINGVHYKSYWAASEMLDVSVHSVRYRCVVADSDRFKNWIALPATKGEE